MTIIECKAVLGIMCALAAGVYLFICGWLSVSWLYFAKALVVWYKHRSHSNYDADCVHENNDPLASANALDAMEAQTHVPSPRSAQRVFVNEQQGWLGYVPSMVREFRFKINVIHDALLTVATVLPAVAAAGPHDSDTNSSNSNSNSNGSNNSVVNSNSHGGGGVMDDCPSVPSAGAGVGVMSQYYYQASSAHSDCLPVLLAGGSGNNAAGGLVVLYHSNSGCTSLVSIETE
eukprot:TRINITY_DN6927_c0_g1_i2.p1 TRINITY_DN6927_c0_g1~~TRINITY_DN6927_c0_g1_i2.p1  ORF type:complete len:232 (+),score=56.81 TRINITY_DN6927_c0_g1_i2:360-1055(+)